MFEHKAWFILRAMRIRQEFDITTLVLLRYSQESWTQLRCCEVFFANLWRQHLYHFRVRRKYGENTGLWQLPLSQQVTNMDTNKTLSLLKICLDQCGLVAFPKVLSSIHASCECESVLNYMYQQLSIACYQVRFDANKIIESITNSVQCLQGNISTLYFLCQLRTWFEGLVNGSVTSSFSSR